MQAQDDVGNPPHDERLADDILKGAPEIADHTGLTPRQVYHQKENLGLKHLGAMLIGSKKKLRELLTGNAA
jgi:hypothetical protein